MSFSRHGAALEALARRGRLRRVAPAAGAVETRCGPVADRTKTGSTK